MQIVFFSETRWNYLKTRKQQIISRFPPDWQVLFLEPYKLGQKNTLLPRWHGNICAVTMPLFYKNFKPKPIGRLLESRLIRSVVEAVAWLWIKFIMKKTGFSACDIVMASNIYAAPFVENFPKPKVYDMNDNHLAFSHTPAWAEEFFRSLCNAASKIVATSHLLAELVPAKDRDKIVTIGNGVDETLLDSRPIILYVGSVGEWVDVELLVKVAEAYPNASLRMIGPVTVDVRQLGKQPNVEFIGTLPQSMAFDQMRIAACCLVPFAKSDLTHYAEANKIFEYLAADKVIVTTDYSPVLRQYAISCGLFVSGGHEDFVRNVGLALQLYKTAKPARNLPTWNNASAQYARLLQDMV